MTDIALLVIDMQNGFVHPKGSLPSIGITLPDMDAVTAANADLIAAARAANVPVVYTRHVFRDDLLDVPARSRSMLPPDFTLLVRGSWDADVVDELTPEPGDRIIDKNRYDAFLYTDLEVVLRAMGVRRLLVTGVVTSVCVESTVRSAEQRDFDVYVASDCTSAEPALHAGALAAMAAIFATVGTGKELLDQLLTDRPVAAGRRL
jgi:ureidoacrylate peracid hydrolase